MSDGRTGTAALELRKVDLPPYSLWEVRGGSGTPILLVHGLSGSSRWWSRNVDALAQTHLVAAIDLIGFGRNRRFTAMPHVLPPFREVSALVARWIETFGERVHLVGHSMGGAIALRVAAERPDLLRSLILVNSAGVPIVFDPLPHVRSIPRVPWQAWSLARVLVPDLVRAGPTSVAVASARVLTADARRWMDAVRVPTLLVWGETDPLLPLRYAEEMKRAISGSKLVVVPRAAHVTMWDNPEEFNRVALEFTDEVERSGGDPYRVRIFGWGISGWNEGIAHRQAGDRRDLVLVHGLGMSSEYFHPFARALFDAGWNPIAPDLPGFGASVNAPSSDAVGHAEILASWADRVGIRDAVWVGHSIANHAVDRLAMMRPDLVRRCVFIGPLWSMRSPWRLLGALLVDATREPLALFPYVIRAYWRTGLLRWWQTFRKYCGERASRPQSPAVSAGDSGDRARRPITAGETPALLIAGSRDPLVRIATRKVPGAHACHFSHPEETAQAISEAISPPAVSSEDVSARDSSTSPGPYSGEVARF